MGGQFEAAEVSAKRDCLGRGRRFRTPHMGLEVIVTWLAQLGKRAKL